MSKRLLDVDAEKSGGSDTKKFAISSGLDDDDDDDDDDIDQVDHKTNLQLSKVSLI